ncbi:hypothetical protein FHR70_003746 [Microvirga lupini]|uniref:Uncharacterized protein n=1 Tax=Microvirga lupini TaxID=420324 RepID=A0A7W4YXM3_9HYPH|nr:hypothetical protein [Microvirga lupini]
MQTILLTDLICECALSGKSKALKPNQDKAFRVIFNRRAESKVRTQMLTVAKKGTSK